MNIVFATYLDYGSISISIIALLIAVLSYHFSIRSWRETNRPIVTAKVDTHSSGNKGTALNLVVSNTGNRPAKNIRLSADTEYLKSFLNEKINELPESIQCCFSDRGIIPILENGREVTNSFGTIATDAPVWKGDQTTEIRLSYEDLDGRKFSHLIPIFITNNKGFAGSFWGEKLSSR